MAICQHAIVRNGLPPALCKLSMICNIRAIVEGQVMPAYELAILGAHLRRPKAWEETEGNVGSGKCTPVYGYALGMSINCKQQERTTSISI